MEIHKIITLIKSPVLADTKIGLSLLCRHYTDDEILNVFNHYGCITDSDSTTAAATRYFLRKEMEGWNYLHTGKFGFFVGRSCIIVEHPHKNKDYYPNEEL